MNYINESKLINLIEQFKQDIEGLPIEDIKYYQEEFKQDILDRFNIELEFENDSISY